MMKNTPTLSLRVPEPSGRPGDAPDFSHLQFDPAETQQTGDKGDDGEDERPFQHVGNLRFSPQANEPREMEVPPERKATPLS
jgi:hypothetical protein